MGINLSLVKIVPAEESHREFSYQLVETAYKGYIEEIWGWDEKTAEEFHTHNWLNKRPNIIMYDSQPIGTIYLHEAPDFMELEQFILLPEYQNQGIGSYILRNIMDRADQSGQIIKLKYVHVNPVASLYHRMGFNVTKADDEFIYAERKPGSGE